MRRSLAPFAALTIAGILASPTVSPAQTPRAATSRTSQAVRQAAPRLVVILVVDQMRADYVTRYSRDWTGGLRRLLDQGAYFAQATYPYMETVTCVGHSTIVTGSLPRTHGVISNTLFDRAAAKSGNCVADPETTFVSYGDAVNGSATSTRNLLVPALPDEMRAQMAVQPRIVSVSMKDYTATTMAGRRADAALWFSASARTLLTTSALAQGPSPWVAEFLKANRPESDFGKTWTKLLPESAYLHEDDAVGEATPGAWTRSFPHVLKGGGQAPDRAFYAEWMASPFSDRFLGRLAERAVSTLGLGSRSATDYLAISFTALDAVGHAFGPRSHEVQDLLAQLDRTIGSLLACLDQRVGRGNYVVALTGDHGTAPVPEQMSALGIDAGRVPSRDVTSRVEGALEPFLGAGKKVAWVSGGDVYFEPGVVDQLRANPSAMRAAVDSLRKMPGVARVFTADQIESAEWAETDDIARAVAEGFYAPRSADLVAVLRPYYQFGASSAPATGTGHGSPYGYDRRVPLVLFGKGIRPGAYTGAVSPVDIAPTLAFLCGITLPAADGRALTEAIAAPTAPPPR